LIKEDTMATVARAPGHAAKLNPYGLVPADLLPHPLREEDGLPDLFNLNAARLTRYLDEAKEEVVVIRRDYKPEAQHERVRAVHDKTEKNIEEEGQARRKAPASYIAQLETRLEPERIKLPGMSDVVQELRAESIRRALERLDPVQRALEVRTAASHVDRTGAPLPDRELLAAVDGAPRSWQRAMGLDGVLAQAREGLGKAVDPEAFANLTIYRTALQLIDSNTATARQSLHAITRIPRGLVSPPAGQALASRRLG
jgi:hypothetical protein